ncbi:MAG: hypothetical protein Q9228_002763 [Teloschistes exilis]
MPPSRASLTQTTTAGGSPSYCLIDSSSGLHLRFILRKHEMLTDSVQPTDLSSSRADLELITNAPGPPTIQPGIPSLQPSIPTSGVASLSIPPWHQAPSSKTSDHLPSSEYPQIPSLATTSTPTSTQTTSVKYFKSRSTSIAASIPYLSELITQPVTRSPAVSLPTFTIAPALSSSDVQSSIAGTQSPKEVPSGQITTPPAGGSDPKDGILTASMPSTLIYSFLLPSYSGGLDSNGIAETQTLSSSTKDKDYQPSASIYSYSLPPYTPKIPTYVATSASVAATSMTTGASGYPSANDAHTTRVFLPKGSVDPLKDISGVATSSTVPLYSPACLGNAYGGGYVITPSVSAPNVNGTAVAKVPPAYGFTYKLEPTQSPGYSAAVVIASAGGPAPTRAPLPITATSGSLTRAAGGEIVQISETSTVITCPCEDTPTFTTTVTEDLVTQGLATGQSVITHSNLNPTIASVTTGSAYSGSYQTTSLNQVTATSSGHSIISSLSSKIVPNTVSGLRNPSIHSSVASIKPVGSNPGKDGKLSNIAAAISSSAVSGSSPNVLPQAGLSNTAPVTSSRFEGSATQANSMGPNLAQGSPSTGLWTDSPASVMGSVASYTHHTLQVNSFPGNGASDAGISSTVTKDAVHNDYSTYKAGSAATGASSGLSIVDSAGATRLPQNQYHRAAVTLGNTAVNNNSAVTSQYLGSQLNDTLMPADDGTETTAFRGDADQITASKMSALVLSVSVCLLFSIF